jgi:2-dehydro-3-deoxyphosphooctonate aldolase (KDO 8-P synthase)
VINNVSIPGFTLGRGHPLFVIAGPCVLEDETCPLEVGRQISNICKKHNVPFIFKSSYDKANRTSLGSFRGPGFKEGLEILQKIKDELNVPILTDVHETDEVEGTAEVADILQIPAFLCRQTDFIRTVARAGKPVNVKKGQFLTPWDLSNVIEKIEDTGNHQILLTERGVSFGYNNLVVDFRSFPVMAKTGYPVIFDVTHSVQLPGGNGETTGGQKEFIQPLARAAVAAGVDGLFLETHPDPDNAPCDGDCMLPLSELDQLLTDIVKIRKALE